MYTKNGDIKPQYDNKVSSKVKVIIKGHEYSYILEQVKSWAKQKCM